jgi:hypothetical protein
VRVNAQQRHGRRVVWTAGLISILPFVVFWKSFQQLYFLNPLYHLLSIPRKTMGFTAIVLYGSVKFAVVAWALWKAESRWRPMLLSLLALDLAAAAALGAGRFQLELDTAVSWRYQYISLLVFGPFAGLLLARHKGTVQAAALLIWILILAYPWKRHVPLWADGRGLQIRARVATYPADARFDPSSLTAGRARELERLYHLH